MTSSLMLPAIRDILFQVYAFHPIIRNVMMVKPGGCKDLTIILQKTRLNPMSKAPKTTENS